MDINPFKKKIGFYIECFTYRGTCTALFEYAFYNETILKNKSIIIFDNSAKVHPDSDKKVYDKFRQTFQDIRLIKDINDIEDLDAVYCIKYGKRDKHFNVFSSDIIPDKKIKTLIHSVFFMNNDNKHGDVYVCARNTQIIRT